MGETGLYRFEDQSGSFNNCPNILEISCPNILSNNDGLRIQTARPEHIIVNGF